MDRPFGCAVAWIVVTQTELEAALRMYPWRELRREGDDQLYYEASMGSGAARGRRVVLAQQDEMGMTACAALCMKVIENFRPEYLVMVGIAAGTAMRHVEEQEYGDVIVPDVVWNYASGKYVAPEHSDIRFGNLGFVPRPVTDSLLDGIRDEVEAAIASPDNECHVYIGPMATGNAVVANSEVLSKQVRSQLEHTAGLDMEAYAVVYTAHHATEPRPRPLIVKSVCDFADSRKDDRFQKFAAYTAAQFAKFMAEGFLPFGEDPATWYEVG